MTITETNKGLVLNVDFITGDVFRDSSGDCTNGGASSKYDKLYVVAEHVTLEDVQQLCKDRPAYNIDQFFKLDYNFYNQINPIFKGYCRLKPLANPNRWYMHGGNYLGSCDSRFKNFVGGCKYPVPILDRWEGNNIHD